MNKLELKNWVEKNPKLVSMKESESHSDLYVLKYKKRVFYDNLWNRFLEECRGTVIDRDFNVISRPFTKIYNYGIETKAPKLDNDTPVLAYRKVNGFMAAITWYNNDILISTTGSLDSDFVKMVRETINIDHYRSVCQRHSDLTFMFECVHKNDPHIIPEREGMYLIGYRKKDWESGVKITPVDLNTYTYEFGSIPVEEYHTNIGDLLEMVKTVKHEGFVFYTDDGVSAKIKSPHYLVNKFVARNPRTDKLMRKDIKNSMDEEYYPLIDAIQENIESYTALDEQSRLTWVRNFLETV